MKRSLDPSHRLTGCPRAPARRIKLAWLGGLWLIGAAPAWSQVTASFELAGQIETFGNLTQPAPIGFAATGALSTQIQQQNWLEVNGLFGQSIARADVFASIGRLALHGSSDSLAKSNAWVDRFGVLQNYGVHRGSSISSAAAGWNDQVKLDAAGLQGQLGSFNAILRLTGSYSATGSPHLSAGPFPNGEHYSQVFDSRSRIELLGKGIDSLNYQPCRAKTGADFAVACAGYSATNGAENYQLGGVQDIPVKVQFTFGEFFWLGYSLYSFTEARAQLRFNQMAGSGASNADVDLSHTLLWGGIQAIFGPDGAALSAPYALISGSGFDYRNAAPVPEPQSWALLLAGLGLIWLICLRRHRCGPVDQGMHVDGCPVQASWPPCASSQSLSSTSAAA